MRNRRKFSITATLFIIGLMAGCTPSGKGDGSLTITENEGNTFTVCHFNQVNDTIDLKLSEMVEEFKIVRFENSGSTFFLR